MSDAVYFLRGTATGSIKIGFTKWLDTRVAAIKSFNSEPVQLIGAIAGSRKLERELHEEFAADRVRGEWFSPTASLLVRIHGLIASAPAPDDKPKPRPMDDPHTLDARKWLAVIEDGEAARRGCRVTEARPDVAASMGLAVGTLENYRRGRIQSIVSAKEYSVIKSAYIAELQLQLSEAHALIADASALRGEVK